ARGLIKSDPQCPPLSNGGRSGAYGERVDVLRTDHGAFLVGMKFTAFFMLSDPFDAVKRSAASFPRSVKRTSESSRSGFLPIESLEPRNDPLLLVGVDRGRDLDVSATQVP